MHVCLAEIKSYQSTYNLTLIYFVVLLVLKVVSNAYGCCSSLLAVPRRLHTHCVSSALSRLATTALGDDGRVRAHPATVDEEVVDLVRLVHVCAVSDGK